MPGGPLGQFQYFDAVPTFTPRPAASRPVAPRPPAARPKVSRPVPRPEVLTRFELPAPDDLGITLREAVEWPPPDAIGIALE